MGDKGTFLYEIWVARGSLLSGAALTMQLSLAVIAIGSFIGCFGGLGLVYGPAPLRLAIRSVVEVLRGVPVLVLILFCYYGLALFSIDVTAPAAGVIALSGFCAAHMSETFRGAVASIPVGQTEAAKAIGMRFWQRLTYVILPQAARRMLPPWVNTGVEIVKGTTLLSIIGVVELLLSTQQAIARNYLIIQFYLAAALIYIIINFSVSQLGAWLERRFAYFRY
ncbi:MAG: amino acid ABC transporter permease [Ectothiorhodospiraceae bacterium]|nr:amino acid ABC transporter permease [Ectothiorhodospiraceae bacterium]